MAKRWTALLLLLAALTSATAQDNPVLVGRVSKVSDGDTITVQLSSGPISVRFDSIDAPEKNQPWGDEAQRALAGRVNGREVALDVVTQDRYDRLVATVYLGDENVNAWMVQKGHAWAYREYLKNSEYCVWEDDARRARRGLWSLPSGQRAVPWEWRRRQRGQQDTVNDFSADTAEGCIAAMGRDRPVPGSVRSAQPLTLGDVPRPSGGCIIKGNIGNSGKIYHVPESPSYANTKIDESKGERWFCSEEEARAAGWRAPKG